MALINGKQILDASIATAKLAVTPVLPDGTVAMTGALNMGSQRITSLAAPTAASDAARLADVQGIPWKEAVRVASTANLTLSGEQTIDGVLTSASRILVKNQTTASQNGIYVTAAGAWARSADADSTAEVQGAVVSVLEGTAGANLRFAQTEDDVTVGTDAQTWTNIGSGGSAAYPVTSNKNMTASVTTAAYDQATATTLASTPSGDGYLRAYINGVAQVLGDGVRTTDVYLSGDSGATARSIAAAAAGDTLHIGSGLAFNLATTDRIDLDYAV